LDYSVVTCHIPCACWLSTANTDIRDYTSSRITTGYGPPVYASSLILCAKKVFQSQTCIDLKTQKPKTNLSQYKRATGGTRLPPLLQSVDIYFSTTKSPAPSARHCQKPSKKSHKHDATTAHYTPLTICHSRMIHPPRIDNAPPYLDGQIPMDRQMP